MAVSLTFIVSEIPTLLVISASSIIYNDRLKLRVRSGALEESMSGS